MAIEFVHAMPGRLRLRVHALKGGRNPAPSLYDRLLAIPAIRRVDINPRTGSVLLLFDPPALRCPDFVDALSNAMGESFPEDCGTGRLRITVPQLTGHAALAGKMTELLISVDGIHRFEFDPGTGVLFVAYDTHSVTTPEFIDAIATPLDRLIPWISIRKLLARSGLGI